jgi:hypothetical protein
MSWVIKWNGEEVSSDDFTLGELGRVEKEADTSWSIANPLRTAAVAQAFLRIVIARQGGDLMDADRATLGKVKRAFAWSDDGEASEGTEGGEAPDPLPVTSPDSSPGASVVSVGPRKKRAAS